MRFCKKPVVVSAFRFGVDLEPTWFRAAELMGLIAHEIDLKRCTNVCIVRTLEGEMRADEGDYIIRGVKGELYPCKADIFEMTYDAVADAPVVVATGMDFGGAIRALKAGKKVARRGWNGKGIFIELQRPDENSKMTSPYTFIDTTGLQTTNPDAPKSRVPWLASQTDMLATDWEVVE